MLTALPSAHTRRLFPATSSLKCLHKGTGHRDLLHEQFTQSVLKNKLQGLVPQIQTTEFLGLVAGTKLDFVAKMALHTMGLVPATCCMD